MFLAILDGFVFVFKHYYCILCQYINKLTFEKSFLKTKIKMARKLGIMALK